MYGAINHMPQKHSMGDTADSRHSKEQAQAIECAMMGDK